MSEGRGTGGGAGGPLSTCTATTRPDLRFVYFCQDLTDCMTGKSLPCHPDSVSLCVSQGWVSLRVLPTPVTRAQIRNRDSLRTCRYPEEGWGGWDCHPWSH